MKRTLDKQKVMAEAAALVKESGFEKLTFPKLAKRLDIRSQSLYNYFKNTNDLIESMGQNFMDDLYQVIIQELVGLTGKAALRSFGEVIHSYFRAQGQLVTIIYYIQNYGQNSAFRQAMAKILNILDQLVQTLELSKQEQIAFARSFSSAIIGFTAIEIMGYFKPEDQDPDQSFEHTLNLLLADK
ncbi:TetR/AcrR family transcriptional regulator [Agrilactobacillus fermenti]|uniref:TetR/AcrR family transcriptional regulator n=1 Tax=Agrilactobacillus fermenti TaxID=2586909 RepID=UPI001E41CB04|nr:TetR/AcrR family transcriptional regulator [Agrilactobacillus fermenti]MCD2256133.1 TetR/AcrR family transcriptional regulator [Agrilactobacillus fermenti]